MLTHSAPKSENFKEHEMSQATLPILQGYTQSAPDAPAASTEQANPADAPKSADMTSMLWKTALTGFGQAYSQDTGSATPPALKDYNSSGKGGPGGMSGMGGGSSSGSQSGGGGLPSTVST
jgi:hypothetical protein